LKNAKNRKILPIGKLKKPPILDCQAQHFLYWLSLCSLLFWMSKQRWFN